MNCNRMKSFSDRCRVGLATSLILVLALFCVPASRAATSQPTRVAIAPFYAPKGQPALQQTADTIPELLAVELSHQQQFQLVEREKVSAIWDELHMAADGLQEVSTVMKLGHVLLCDWL